MSAQLTLKDRARLTDAWLDAVTRLFGGSINASPLEDPCDGVHELRGVAAHDFAVGYFVSPLEGKVHAATARSKTERPVAAVAQPRTTGWWRCVVLTGRLGVRRCSRAQRLASSPYSNGIRGCGSRHQPVGVRTISGQRGHGSSSLSRSPCIVIPASVTALTTSAIPCIHS